MNRASVDMMDRLCCFARVVEGFVWSAWWYSVRGILGDNRREGGNQGLKSERKWINAYRVRIRLQCSSRPYIPQEDRIES